jgi:hypothetical protein
MLVNSSHEERADGGVWLRVRILKSLVFSLSTTVRAIRDSLRDADTDRAARTVDLAARLIGQKIWTAETISPSPKTVPLRHFGRANLDSIGQKAAYGNGQPALREGSQRVNDAVFCDYQAVFSVNWDSNGGA